ncbi:specific histone demethylase 1 homolog [Seminavis robusta]|uniref:Specific histone demethylase 1 homolog n=1 Tax=Seminavis robusta TaxID=568900 RepID=A0A9N8DXB0_9STRA|nr:specific histone demethylase 1 homolog [Seminavis robusta]|eukprot:Sro436_g142640.1 specific histone demethylase 1 homolog (592) ;mRNA; f:33408-35183
MAAAVEAFDVLVLGAGPAGISAARALLKEGSKSFLVLEARSRLGGRAHASDSLGTQKDLDHGARWIHGVCNDNVMVRLLRELTFDHPDDEGVEYQLCLPKDIDDDDAKLSTDPPFGISDAGDTEVNHSELILKVKGSPEQRPPGKNLTMIVSSSSQDGNITAREASPEARRVSRTIFQEIVESVMENPLETIHSTKASLKLDDGAFEEASLLDLLLLLHDPSHDNNNNNLNDKGKRDRFESICRENLVMKHPQVEETIASLSESEQELFREEVMALFNVEIATVVEAWEGSSLHVLSAKHGMEGTCLGGGHMILPFGYGGLVKRLAFPLVQGNHIRFQHEVISVETTTSSSDNEGSTVVVRCKVTEEGATTIKEFHAKAVVVALPLGVLRSRSIAFEPDLPAPVVHAIQTLGITMRGKIELAFPHCWWPTEYGRFTLACTHLQQSPTYHPYTTFIVESMSGPNILVCYVAGEFSKEIEEKSDEAIQEEIMTVLRQASLASGDIPDPLAIHVTRWLLDPYSRGAWTHCGKGSSPADVKSFRLNEECHQRHLFFAGEHTCDGSTVKGDDFGCVNGAWMSGELAVEAALKCLPS